MKTTFILVMLLAGLATGMAQSAVTEPSLKTDGKSKKREALVSPKQATTVEIRRGNVTYSGIAVQAIKARNPLHLVNPAAPPEYGSGANNAVRDNKGKVVGLKLFAISF
jgi:hypothetical protein